MSAALIVGNWKMNLLAEEATLLAAQLVQRCATLKNSSVWIAPTLLSIPQVSAVVKGSKLLLGAQNIHWEKQGAFTGEVSAQMLQEFGVSFALIGHSERRHVFGESNELCAKRLGACLHSEITAIFCVGESLAQREGGATNSTLEAQLGAAIDSFADAQLSKLIIAYEPVWAIGTGKVAGALEINQAHGHIKSFWENRSKKSAPPILYGGSVNPENLKSILELPLVSGVLVGGASLSFDKFAKMIEIAEALA